MLLLCTTWAEVVGLTITLIAAMFTVMNAHHVHVLTENTVHLLKESTLSYYDIKCRMYAF